jgi:hypothetical protein
LSVKDYGLFYWVVVGILALLVSSPFLSRVLVYPRTEFFTELWILDANHKAENYPFNVTRNENYSIYLGIGNRLGYCAYYMVQVKFRNQTQPAPTSFGPIENRFPSNLTSLFNITAFVADEQVWELPITFSFNYIYNDSLSRVELSGLRLNNVELKMADYTIAWNSEKSEFQGFLFFELWLYNTAENVFQYHGRFVSLRFNMTIPL